MKKELNEYVQSIEDGKAIMRKEGLNFNAFKTQMREFFVNPGALDEDGMVYFYNVFAATKGKYPTEKLKQWAAWHFKDFNRDEHEFWLTPAMKRLQK